MQTYYSFNNVARRYCEASASNEASRFISALPSDFVEAQKRAIVNAIGGDSTELDAIRAARKAPTLEEPEVDVFDINIGERLLRLRIYTPRTRLSRTRDILVYLHGGGWTINCPEACERFCRDFCSKNDAIVVAPDYRLAPENPYPAANIDCLEAYEWIALNASLIGGNAKRIYIAGDSAGGHLAISTALAIRDGASLYRPAGIIMFYPVLDLTSARRASYKYFGQKYCLNAELMELFMRAYLPNPVHARKASPFYAELSGLPRILLVASECDILREEAEYFFLKLVVDDVKARYLCIEGATHLFITQNGMDEAYKRALQEASEFVARRF